MITLNGATANYVGLSTDNKPENIEINSLLLELDTGNFYYFNGTDWIEVGKSE